MKTDLSPAVKAYTVGLLTFIWTANYLDRQILAILLESIKVEMMLSDTQLGLLSGLAFAIFYATLGLPIAYLADRYNRKRIIVSALMLFSLMTYACGLAQSYSQLLLARIGVAVGEAGTNPPSIAMIADMYEPDRRATPLAIFAVGINLGIFIAFAFGGWIAMEYGWRATFQITAIPGVLLALIAIFTLRDPPRGMSDSCEAPSQAQPLLQVIRFMIGGRALRHLIIAMTLVVGLSYGTIAWIPAYLIRVHELTTTEIGLALALIVGVGGGIATALCGIAADRLGQRDKRWNLWLLGLIACFTAPLLMAAFNTSTALWSFILLAPSISLTAVYIGPGLAMLQGLVRPQMRALSAAVLILVSNLFGLGLGPLAVGVISDRLSAEYGAGSLSIALTLLSMISFWAAWHFYLAAKHLPEGVARVAETSDEKEMPV